MRILDNVISDRGSKYAVSGGPCASEEQAKAFLKELCRKKKFAKATHNTWALLTAEAPLKNDDGEAGAAMVILRMLEREGLRNHIVVVTRWFGGKHLGGDRFQLVEVAPGDEGGQWPGIQKIHADDLGRKAGHCTQSHPARKARQNTYVELPDVYFCTLLKWGGLPYHSTHPRPSA